jgi:excisionase family DNA binding protein
MTDPGSGPLETYRQAEQQLRLLLLGDGIDAVGQVKGEEQRRRVTAQLRRMRSAVDALLERDDLPAAGSSSLTLEEDLQRMAASRSQTQDTAAASTFVTPAEASEELRMSVSSIYRAVRAGQIRAVRLTERGALRIPRSELVRLSEGSMARQG